MVKAKGREDKMDDPFYMGTDEDAGDEQEDGNAGNKQVE